jgi:hypothetical protein
MLVLFQLWDNAMHITFKDIRQRHKDLQDKFSVRQFELQECARKLVSEYIDSLSLPSEVWIDANKVPHPYVAVGLHNDKGLFQQMPFSGLRLDKEYKLKFKISTTVDDSEYGGGSYHLVAVAMWKENGRLKVDLSEGKKNILVPDPEENRAFVEVCVAMKEIVISGCTDPRLD